MNGSGKNSSENLQAQSEETLLGFCVMGGIFSEGIDLIGDRLIGVAVVGTGLPQVSCRKRDPERVL